MQKKGYMEMGEQLYLEPLNCYVYDSNVKYYDLKDF